MRRAMLALLLCLFASACLGGATSDRLTFRAGGFSIEPLEGFQVLAMTLPVSDAFAPNVNVQIQPYPGTLDDYVALSKQQSREHGLDIVREAQNGESGYVIEYKGSMAGRDMHWHAKAELRQNKVYLATATALEGQWPSVSDKLKACVDSLQVAQ